MVGLYKAQKVKGYLLSYLATTLLSSVINYYIHCESSCLVSRGLGSLAIDAPSPLLLVWVFCDNPKPQGSQTVPEPENRNPKPNTPKPLNPDTLYPRFP